MDKFEIKTVFKHMEYDKKFDHGNMANVNDILYANPMQGVMEQIQDVVHRSNLAHDNFINECIVSVGIDPNALIETARLNAALQAELKLLRAERERRADPWISVDERLPEPNEECLVSARVGDRVVIDLGEIVRYCDGRIFGWMTTNDWDEGEGCKITHWMPLPEPPEGD